jgi:hypothetical protein
MSIMDGSYVRKSLLSEMTTLGVDDWLLIINVELALFIIGILKFHHWAWVTLLAHFMLVWVTQAQPRILAVYFKHMNQGDRYDAWSALPLKRGKRPQWLQELVSRDS